MIVWDKKAPWPAKYAATVFSMPTLVREVLEGKRGAVQCGDILVGPAGDGVTLSKAAFIALVDNPVEPKKAKAA